MTLHHVIRFAAIAASLCVIAPLHAEPTQKEVSVALHRAVSFFRQHASAGGGYIYQLSADLTKREGEGRVGKSTAWIEPPATPSVGMAYLNAYRLCGDSMLLDAAIETATALVRGQLRSGGWDNRIEFDTRERANYSYRVDSDSGKKQRNTTTFDDDKTQSAIRFLIQLDQELEFKDAAIHECVLYALDAVLKSQYAIGAWPQRYSQFPESGESEQIRASLPDTWSREYPGDKYQSFYTLNDGTISDLIVTMLDAWETYNDARYLASALRGGDFLLLAQLPEPQPGWAQQYDRDMHPTWARKFEPPAISGGESQGVMRTLMLLFRHAASSTENAERFLAPIPTAIAYYRRSQLADGRLARFYELKTNRPLFFTTEYKLVYHTRDLPTHYGFIVDSKVDQLEQELKRIRQTPVNELWQAKSIRGVKRTAKLDRQVEQVVNDLDGRGAWVEPGRLRYHGDDDLTDKVIRSDTFAKNLRIVASWLASDAPN